MIAAAAAAAEPALPASSSIISAVPERTITINGDYSDWQGLPPAFVDAKGDCNREFPGLDIKEIYLAKDLKNLYVRFVLFDEGFPAYPPVNMSAEVQLELGNADFLNLAMRYNKEWRSQLEIYNSSSKQLFTLAQGVLKRGGTGCEASFPIAAFYKRVQAGKEYRTIGQIWMSSNWGQLDNAGESRLLTF
jgi:hypothetical protein